MTIKRCEKVQVTIMTSEKVLLLKTNKSRGMFWQNVTGAVEQGESFEQAATRELREETGENAKALHSLNFEFEFIDEKRKVEYLEKCFLYFTKDEFVPHLDSREHEAFQWKLVDQVELEDFGFESNYEVFKLAKSFLSGLAS